MQYLKSNPEIFQELMSGNVAGLKGTILLHHMHIFNSTIEREERILEGDKKGEADVEEELSDFELELRRVSLTRTVVWLKHHQAELDAMKEQELTRLLAVVGLVPVELQPEDIFDELVQQRLISVRPLYSLYKGALWVLTVSDLGVRSAQDPSGAGEAAAERQRDAITLQERVVFVLDVFNVLGCHSRIRFCSQHVPRQVKLCKIIEFNMRGFIYNNFVQFGVVYSQELTVASEICSF